MLCIASGLIDTMAISKCWVEQLFAIEYHLMAFLLSLQFFMLSPHLCFDDEHSSRSDHYMINIGRFTPSLKREVVIDSVIYLGGLL